MKHKKNPQTRQNLILMGKGPISKIKPVNGPRFAISAGPIFDPEQSKLNKQQGLW